MSDEQIKQRQRAMWSSGDYPDIARSIESVAATVVEAAGVESGHAVLDVATGTGNAALIAARKGARVTGLDLTPELVAVAERRAAEEDLEISFEEGDAEALPYPDDSFDRVTSVFGVMFAPEQQTAADELLRVAGAGGTVAVAAWTPGGLNGQMFATMAKHLPPPPEGFRPPVLWGDEGAVRELFSDAGSIECRVTRAEGSVGAESPSAWVDYLERALGPVHLARRALEPEGRWEDARADLLELYERFNEAEDGGFRAAPEYLLTVVG